MLPYNINPKSRLASPTHPAPSDCVLGRAVKVEGEVVGLAEITTFIFAASSINFLNFFYIIIPEAVVTLTVRRYAVCTHRVTVTGGHQDILSVITYLLAGENWSFASCVVFHKTSKPLFLSLCSWRPVAVMLSSVHPCSSQLRM